MEPTSEAAEHPHAQLMQQLQLRRATRLANLAPTLRNDARNLKSDLKKGTIIAKKFRTYTAEMEKTILSELATFNMKMFVTETAQNIGPALYENPKVMKPSDAASLAQVCSVLHQRYEEFLPEVLSSVKKGFDMVPMIAEMEKKFDVTVPPADLSRLKIAIRLMTEFWLLGLVPDAKFVIGILGKIASVLEKGVARSDDGAPNPAAGAVAAHLTVNTLTIVGQIIRNAGIEITGGSTQPNTLKVAGFGHAKLQYGDEGISSIDETVRRTLIEQCDIRRDDPLTRSGSLATEQERHAFSKAVTIILEHALNLCVKLKKGVEAKWRSMCEQAELRGDPAQEVKDAFHALRREAERCYVLTENIASAVGRESDMPDQINLTAALQKSLVDSQITFTSGMADFFTVKVAETVNYYDDDEQRQFYEELTTIGSLIPPMENDGKGIPLTVQQLQRRGGSNPQGVSIALMDDTLADAIPPSDGTTKGMAAISVDDKKAMDYTRIEELLISLHRCCSVNTVDQWVQDYATEATKYMFPARLEAAGLSPVRPSQAYHFFMNCKLMLLVELRYEPDRAQELIPFLARAAASWHQRFPEIGEALARQLENHIQDAVRNHKPNTFHSKMLNTRYLCELVKFRVCPPIRVIRIFYLVIDNFEDQHCAQMATILVEHVTSFLLRGGITKAKAEDCLIKLKQAAASKGIPTQVESQYEHAWGELRRVLMPNRKRKIVARIRTPLEQFVGHLLYTKLKDDDESFVYVRQRVLKLPWRGIPGSTNPQDDRDAKEMLIRVFRKAYKLGYDRIHLLAELIGDVSRAEGTACLLQPVIDHIFEDLRQDLETQGTNRNMQKRLQDMKFIAELYNFKLISFRLLTFTIAQLLLYSPKGPISPTDFSRLRCATHLIRLSAPYFLHSGKPPMKQATRHILALLFVHIHSRQRPLPLDLDYILEDMLKEVSKLYDDDLRKKDRRGGHRHHHHHHDGDQPQYLFIERFPKTPKAAAEYQIQVNCETLHNDNEFMPDMIRALTHLDHGRTFPVLSMVAASATLLADAGSRAGLGATDSASRKRGPLARPVESKRDVIDDDDDGSSESNSSSGSDDTSDEDDDTNSDEEDDEDDSSSNSSSGSTSSSTSDDEEDDRFAHKLGPLAHAHLCNSRGPQRGGTTNEEDIEFDSMFRDVVKESSVDGVKRLQNKTTQQMEKMMETRLTGISVQSAVKQSTETETALRLLTAYSEERSSTAGTRKEAPSAMEGPSGIRVAVLRRGAPSGAQQQRQQEVRTLYIPADSEFAQRSQAFVEQSQKDKALLHQRTRMILRQHEEEEARLSWPVHVRGGRGGHGHHHHHNHQQPTPDSSGALADQPSSATDAASSVSVSGGSNAPLGRGGRAAKPIPKDGVALRSSVAFGR